MLIVHNRNYEIPEMNDVLCTGFRCGLGVRHFLAFATFLGLTMSTVIRSFIGITIVAMTKHNYTSPERNGSEWNSETCGHSADNENSQGSDEGEFDWDEEMQGHVISSFFYGYICTHLLGGYLTRHFQTRLICGASVTLSGLFTLIGPVAARTNVGLLICTRTLTGLSAGVLVPSIYTLMCNWFHPQERIKISSFIYSAYYLGPFIASSFSAILIEAGGWHMPYYIFGSAAIAWVFLWLYFGYSVPDKHPRISVKEMAYIESGLSKAGDSKENLKIPWGNIFLSLPVWAWLLHHWGVMWLKNVLILELPTYLKEILHFSVKDSGLIIATITLTTFVLSLAVGWLSQKIKSKGFITLLVCYKIFNSLSCIMVSVALITIALIGCERYAIVAMLILMAVGQSMLYGGSALVNVLDLAPQFSGILTGLDQSFATATGIIAPLLVGILTNNNQSKIQWAKLFYVTSGIVISSNIFYLIFGSSKEQSWNKKQTKEEYETNVHKS